MKSLMGNTDTGCEKRRARQRGFAAVMEWTAAALLCWAELSHAATYQLQADSVPEHVFRYFLEQETLPNIEAFLDDPRRSRRVMFGDRQPQPLGLVTAGDAELVAVDVSLSRRRTHSARYPEETTVEFLELNSSQRMNTPGKQSASPGHSCSTLR